MTITVGDLPVSVTFKRIRNLNLRVLPPAGDVRVSAPSRVALAAVHDFVRDRLEWIGRQQVIVRNRHDEWHRDVVDGESRNVWGVPYTLRVIEGARIPGVRLEGDCIVMGVRRGTTAAGRATILERWYCKLVREELSPMLRYWQPIMGVSVERAHVRRMKTRWGTCSCRARTIRINSELAKRPPECLRYVVIHELAHLIEPSHNARFVALMDRCMPGWRSVRAALRR
jgi:predicted metal-dependent hydrolase